jgi:(2Fe-2S) ferredoxin
MSKFFDHAPDCIFYACCGSKCKKKGGKHLFKTLKGLVKETHLKNKIQVIKTGCTDRCKMGPVIAVMPDNKWYLQVSEEKAVEVFRQRVSAIKDQKTTV